MKSKITFLSITILSVILMSCSKDEDVVTTPPAVVTPPPSVVTPPVTVTPPEDNTTEETTPEPYTTGDITISSRTELYAYREQTITTVTGDLNITIDWGSIDNSRNDPSVFTSNIEVVTGNVTINTTEEFSMENLVRVDGDYSVVGHDIIDDNLLYAKSITLDYDDDYVIDAVYTDQINLGLTDDTSAKSKTNTSKSILRNIDIHAYHTSLLADTNFTSDNLPSIRLISPEMPSTPIYPGLSQLSLDVSNTLISNEIKNMTFSGHVSIEKIVSNSITALNILNSALDKLTVESNSLVSITMPNLKTINSLAFVCQGVNTFVAPKLTSITGELKLAGISNVTMVGLTSIGTLTVLSGYKINLPAVKTITNSTIPSNVRLTASSSSGLSQGSVGGGGGSSSSSSGSSGSASSDNSHNSGGAGHNSGGAGHNSGGSSK